MATVLDELLVHIGPKFTGGAELRKLESGVARAQKRLSGLATGLTLAGTAISASAGFAVRTFLDFETAQNQLQATLNVTADDMAALREQAKLLGRTTEFSATQTTEAQVQLAQAGFDLNEILAATPAVLALASAGQLAMGEAAALTANQLRAFNLGVDQTQRVVDVLAATASSANTTVLALGPAFRQVAPIASAAGLTIEQTASYIAILRNNGLAAEQAGTALRAVLGRLADPSGEVEKALAGIGVDPGFVKRQVEAGNLQAVLQALRTAGLDVGDAMKLFGQEAGAAGIILTQNADAAAAMSAQYEQATGTAQRMADVQNQGLVGSVRNLRSAFEGLQIAVGESGLGAAVDWTARRLTILTNRLTEGEPWVRKLIAAGLLGGPAMIGLGAGLKGVSFALGPFAGLLMWGGRQLGIFTGQAAASATAANTAAVANRGLATSLLGPVGLVAALVAGAAAWATFWQRANDRRLPELQTKLGELSEDDPRRARAASLVREAEEIQARLDSADKVERRRMQNRGELARRQALLREAESILDVDLTATAREIQRLEERANVARSRRVVEQENRRLNRLRGDLAVSLGIEPEGVDAEIGRILEAAGDAGPIDRSAEELAIDDADRSAEGRLMASTFAAGVAEGAPEIEAAVARALASVDDYLPQSDALRGPLSRLTAAGRSIMATLARGVESAPNRLLDAVVDALPDLEIPIKARTEAEALTIGEQPPLTVGALIDPTTAQPQPKPPGDIGLPTGEAPGEDAGPSLLDRLKDAVGVQPRGAPAGGSDIGIQSTGADLGPSLFDRFRTALPDLDAIAPPLPVGPVPAPAAAAGNTSLTVTLGEGSIVINAPGGDAEDIAERIGGELQNQWRALAEQLDSRVRA